MGPSRLDQDGTNEGTLEAEGRYCPDTVIGQYPPANDTMCTDETPIVNPNTTQSSESYDKEQRLLRAGEGQGLTRAVKRPMIRLEDLVKAVDRGLSPRAWMNDELINCAISRQASDTISVVDSLKATSPSSQSLHKKLTIIPANDANTHWRLYVYSSSKNILRFFDSFQGSRDTITEAISKGIQTALSTPDIQAPMPEVDLVSCPQQSNTYDCGLFTVRFAQAVANRKSVNGLAEEPSEKMRQQLAHAILTSTAATLPVLPSSLSFRKTVAIRMDYIRALKNNGLQTHNDILKLGVRLLHETSLKLHKRHRPMLRRALALSIESDKELKQLEDLSTYNDRTLSIDTHRTSKDPTTDQAAAGYGKNVGTIDQEMLIQKRAIKVEAVSAWGEIKVMIIMMHVWRQRYNVLRDELVMD